ncbi:MAG: hypothetical protein Q9188_007034 [Gyalolechia gomerana]
MDGVDERPVAVRRKRRTSTRLADPVAQEVTFQPLNEAATLEDAPREPPKTPGNRKKRARFSEPADIVAISSTGLTPVLNRTKLVTAKNKAHKRLSLPIQAMASTASPSSPQLPNTLSSKVIQFAPLRQVIDSRMMRRLKRNHLGDEVNGIFAERKKSKLSLQQEIEDLREELALATDGSGEAMHTTETGSEGGGRIAELENELSSLKREMCEQSAAIDTTVPRHASADRALVDADSPDEVISMGQQVLDLQGDDIVAPGVDQPRSPTNVVEASTQVDLPSPSLSDICRSGRLSLEYLFPGEITLGLDVTDPQPLLEAIISRAEKLKAELVKIEQKVAVSETSTTNMGRHLNATLTQIERINGQIKILKQQHEQEKERAHYFELEAATLEARVDNTKEKYIAVEKQRDEHQRSIERLRPALDYYQSEVNELTRTIMDLESSHEAALNNCRAELTDDNDAAQACQQLAFEEAKSDLEAQVAAETTGRRKAEESAVERLGRIKELENRQKKFQSAVHEKQSIVRDLECELEQTKSSQEKEVGQLNVRIGELVSDLSSANAELAAARIEVMRLADMVQEEKKAGLSAVKAMQLEMKKCSNKVDAVKDNHAEGAKKRGEQVAQSFGLMTPVVDGGKFRDAEADEKVEGHVQFVRGKNRAQRPDSGVEIWGMINEEDEDEVEIGVEVDFDTDVLMAE